MSIFYKYFLDFLPYIYYNIFVKIFNVQEYIMTKIDIFSGFLGAGKTTLIKKLIKDMAIAKIKIGFAILFKPIPQARITVISDNKLKLFKVITVANKTPIGIVITKIAGRCNIIIISAILNGTP